MLNQDIANGNLMHDHEINKEKVNYKSTGTGTGTVPTVFR